jgi:tetratricopeptide (TPR) repeat protein
MNRLSLHPRPLTARPATWAVAALAACAAALLGGGRAAAASGAAPADPDGAAFAAAAAAAARDASTPAAFPAVLRLIALRERLDAARYEEALERLARRPRTDPRVAATVTRARAELLRGRGDDPGALALEAPLGLVRHWYVGGPVAAPRGAGLATPHPVVAALTTPGADGLLPTPTAVSVDNGSDAAEGLGFRPAAARADGVLNLESLLWPPGEVVAWAVAYVHADREGPAALRFGAAAAARLWWNGVVVHERSGMTDVVFDAEEVGVRLRAGWNVLLVALERGGAPWGLVLRVTAPDGRPLAGVRAAGPGVAPPSVPAARGAAAATAVTPGPHAWWSAQVDRLPLAQRPPAFLADLSLVLRAWGRALPVDRQPAALLAALPDDAPADVLLSMARTEPVEHRRAGILSRLLQREPDHPAALLELARLERERHRYRRALDLLRRLPDATRDGPPARLERARVHLDAQLYGEARVALAALAAEAPATPVVLRTLANLELERGDRQAALALFERLAATLGDDPEVVFWLAQLHRDLREPERALGWLRRSAALRPDLAQPLLEQARTLDALGRAGEAERLLAEALAGFPRTPEVLEAAAAFHHRHGESGRALALWRRSLALQPHNPDLRAYLSHLSPSDPSFEGPFRRDPAAVAAAARGPDGTFAAPPSTGEDVSVLLDQRVVRVFGNGAVSRFQAHVFAVHRPPASEDERRYRILFDPLRQRVEVLDVAVHTPDGRRREQLGRRELRLSEAWYGLYYDLHAIDVTFADLAPGDALSVAWRVVDLEPGPRAGTFGDLAFLQGPAARREVDYVVVAPAELPLHHRLVAPRGALPAQEVDEEVADGVRTVRYRLADVPAVPQEEGAPGEAERAAFVHVSTFRQYDEVGRWWQALARDAGRPSAALQAAAAAAVGGLGAPEARLAAVHRAVVDRIRYVGLEFGIHGIRPFDAPEVFERRFGDCKDTATLLSVMLGEVGMTGEVVLVRTRPLGHLPEWPASLAAFDHAILYVPALDLWIDATVRDAPPGVLPPPDQGALALRLTADGPRLVTVPRSPAAADRAVLERAVTLAADGSARVRGEERWSGWRGAELRRGLRTPLERARRVQERLAARQPGVAVTEVAVEGVEALDPELRVAWTAAVPTLAEPDRVGLRLAAAPLEPPLTPRVSPALAAVQDGRRRALPLDVPNRFAEEIRVRVLLPEGWELATAPADRRLDGPYGRFARRIEATEDGWVATFDLSVDATVVPAAEVPAFAAFCEAVDRALAEPLVVHPPAVGVAR